MIETEINKLKHELFELSRNTTNTTSFQFENVEVNINTNGQLNIGEICN